MNGRTVVWGLCALLWGAASVAAQPASQSEYIVPIKIYQDHLILVRGALGNLRDRNFIIDTGAYPSVIDQETAHKLKLPSHPIDVHVLERNLRGGGSFLPLVEVGPLRVHDIEVVVEDLSELSAQAGVRVDALIGLDVLAHASFRIDYVAGVLVFGAPSQLAFSAPMEWRASMACVLMSVDGHPVHMLIDSGGARTVLFSQRLPWTSGQTGRASFFANPAGRFYLREMRATEVEVGDVPVAPNEMYVSDATNMSPYPFDGFLATRTPHVRRVAFDFTHGVFSWDSDYSSAPKGKKAGMPRVLTAASGDTGGAVPPDAGLQTAPVLAAVPGSQ